jgi:hypothetical protein
MKPLHNPWTTCLFGDKALVPTARPSCVLVVRRPSWLLRHSRCQLQPHHRPPSVRLLLRLVRAPSAFGPSSSPARESYIRHWRTRACVWTEKEAEEFFCSSTTGKKRWSEHQLEDKELTCVWFVYDAVRVPCFMQWRTQDFEVGYAQTKEKF